MFANKPKESSKKTVKSTKGFDKYYESFLEL